MRGRFEDLSGGRFGRLVVLERAENDAKGRTRWTCLCDCGNSVCTRASLLKRGTTQSCGCLGRELSVKRNTVHGEAGSRLHKIWANMKNRCSCKSHRAYENYGGRGIEVCEEWQDFREFRDWALSHGYAENLTLDRKDNDGPYAPDNCRWATAKEQGNNRRTNHPLTYNGETKTLSQWAEVLGMSDSTLYSRVVMRGWSLHDAFTRPVRRRGGDSDGCA